MIAVGDVKDLADAAGFVAVVLEQLRKCNDVGHVCADECFEIVNLNRLRPPAGQERGPRRIAERKLAICSIELQAPAAASASILGDLICECP